MVESVGRRYQCPPAPAGTRFMNPPTGIGAA
jgi:hypothetical protein